MPEQPSPAGFIPEPRPYVLAPGTRLWRVHRRSNTSTSFNPRPGGGRFDGPSEDPYPTYYAALDARTALAEVLLRGIPFDPHSGTRTIRRIAVRKRRASVVETTAPLTLVSLRTEEDLAAVAQDQWLIHADPVAYPETRKHAGWIRSQAPWAQGFIWPSRRDAGRSSLVLFGDRCSAASFEPTASHIDLDDLVGAAWINGLLHQYRARIADPPPSGEDP